MRGGPESECSVVNVMEYWHSFAFLTYCKLLWMYYRLSVHSNNSVAEPFFRCLHDGDHCICGYDCCDEENNVCCWVPLWGQVRLRAALKFSLITNKKILVSWCYPTVCQPKNSCHLVNNDHWEYGPDDYGFPI